MVIGLLASITVACGDEAGGDDEETINLKVAHPLSSTSTVAVEGAEFWMNEVEELTDGKVTFDYYPAEQLGKAGTTVDLLNSGTADIALVTPAYYGDELILSTVTELPGTYETVYQASQAYTELLTNNAEFDKLFSEIGGVPMWGSNMGPYEPSTMDKKIESLDDFKGLQIRASGNTQEILYNALGASPISMSSSDMYTALQRGTIDGISYTIANWEAYSVQEELKYSSTNGFFGTTAVFMMFSDDTWSSLPKDIQSAMQEANDKTVEHFAKFMDSQLEEKVVEFTDLGIEMYEFSDELLESIYDVIQEPTFEDWKNKTDEKGYDAQSVLDSFLELVEESPKE